MKKTQKQALAVGAGLAAVAAAATGVYMLTGKNAKNRKKVGKWVNDFQDDIVKELNKAGKVTKATYNKVIDTATKQYAGLKNIKAVELASVAAELKGHWDNISSELQAASSNVRRAVPKSVQRAVSKKTVSKKAPAKKAASKKTAAKKR